MHHEIYVGFEYKLVLYLVANKIDLIESENIVINNEGQ